MKKTININFSCNDVKKIKELLIEIATLSADEVNIQVNYLPASDLSME